MARKRTSSDDIADIERELGAGGIEVDVYFVDGELVVIHDRTLGRTTNGSGFVMRKSFTYLRSLDAGKGEKIPTLAEVFDTVNRRALINVELKGPRTAAPVVRLIEEYVAGRGWSYDDFQLSAFDHKQIAGVKRLQPRIPTGALIERVPRGLAAFAEKLGAASVNPPKERVTPELVADAQKRGLKVLVFTVNEPADIARMKSLGVDGIFCDYPERCR